MKNFKPLSYSYHVKSEFSTPLRPSAGDDYVLTLAWGVQIGGRKSGVDILSTGYLFIINTFRIIPLNELP